MNWFGPFGSSGLPIQSATVKNGSLLRHEIDEKHAEAASDGGTYVLNLNLIHSCFVA